MTLLLICMFKFLGVYMHKEYKLIEMKNTNINNDKKMFNVITFTQPQHIYTFNIEINPDSLCTEINHYFKTYIENYEEKMKIYTEVIHYDDLTMLSDSINFEYDNIPLRCRSRYIKDKNGSIIPHYLFIHNANVETVYK